MPNILEAQNLVKNYEDFTAVKGISLDIKEGETGVKTPLSVGHLPARSPLWANTTIALSDLGENMMGRVFMKTKIFISRAQVPPQFWFFPSPNSSRRSSRVAFGEG